MTAHFAPYHCLPTSCVDNPHADWSYRNISNSEFRCFLCCAPRYIPQQKSASTEATSISAGCGTLRQIYGFNPLIIGVVGGRRVWLLVWHRCDEWAGEIRCSNHFCGVALMYGAEISIMHQNHKDCVRQLALHRSDSVETSISGRLRVSGNSRLTQWDWWSFLELQSWRHI